MTDENTRLPSDSVVEACNHDWAYKGFDYHGSSKDEDQFECRKCGAYEYRLDDRIISHTPAPALAAQPRDDVRELMEAAREDMAMCVAEMSKARGRIETLAGCNEDRRIAAVLGSTCDHLRRRWFDPGTRIDTALSQGDEQPDTDGLAVFDEDELIDEIAEAISDSFDEEWDARDGARHVVGLLEHKGLIALEPTQ